MIESITQKVREQARKLDDFTIDELASALSIQTYEEKRKIRHAISWLKKKGEIIKLRRGLYSYQENQEPLSKVAKMWRAMRIKGYFSKRDIVRLTGASKVHVKKYFIVLKREGFIAHVSGEGYQEAVYCLVDPDNTPLDHPKLTY